MAHQSDNATRLAVRTVEVSRLADLPDSNLNAAEVWLFVLPFGRAIEDAEASAAWWEALHRFARSLNDQSIVAVLTTAADAAETVPRLSDVLHFQLWVAVKLAKPLKREPGQLAEHHAALLVLSKY